jgi:hypothetical protein
MGVEIPDEHLATGIARPPVARKSGSDQPLFVAIHATPSRPAEATVAIKHRGWWFTIDARDTRSKQAFLILRTIIGMRLDQTTPVQSAPVLTVPVNR